MNSICNILRGNITYFNKHFIYLNIKVKFLIKMKTLSFYLVPSPYGLWHPCNSPLGLGAIAGVECLLASFPNYIELK
jgi:hypothetical protein